MSNISVEYVDYQVAGQDLQGCVVFPKGAKNQPGVLLAPNWMGVADVAINTAKSVAEKGYVVFVADLYGAKVRPTNGDEAAAAMMAVKDQPAERQRMQGALDALLAQQHAPVNVAKVAAIGFCFGGHCVLELARSGAKLNAFVTFHGGLDTKDTDGAKNISGSVLVLNGAEDPLIPAEQISGFVEEMKGHHVDWQLINYGGAVHSFTDPTANVPGMSQYNEKVTHRAFAQMYQLFADVL
ncbi:MAG: dienelactone hydrolase family protein [Ewingella sp.]|nr:dienelactone hydrolase family protein [Ewingella sp.]